MEVLPRTASTSLMPFHSMDMSRSPDCSFDAQDGTIMWDAEAQGVNKKLMRLAVDSRTSTKRSSAMFDEPTPTIHREKSIGTKAQDGNNIPVSNMKIGQSNESEDARFPRMEEMSHFHYNNVDFGGPITAALCLDENEDISTLDTGQALLVQVNSGDKSWVVKRSQEDFVGLDHQIHRCLYSRKYSKLPPLKEYDLETKLNASMVQQLQLYLSRFSEVAGNNVNCGPILNWLELDNHGNHLVVMEADDSAINVPAVAAGRVIKRYQAQAPDEMTLEVGDFISVIDIPPVEETIWWRGKKGFEVGFFPSHCVEILREKEINDQILAHLQSRPISKRRGKFINFLRFFFKSRPSKDELMQHGILRERVFGCDLGERLAHIGRDIPLVLQLCAEVIEEHGVVDGIYRLSGIMSNLQRLRVSFDNDDEPPNLKDTRYLHDIHCISSLLKTYFRELPNPLFTYELYDKFVLAIGKDDDTEKTVAFHHVIQRLPPPHYRTMNYLLRHLNFCASKAAETNMTAKNLAIVWAPNLLRPPSDDSISALTEFRTQAIIVEYMIRNVDVFFDKNLASAAIAYYPEVQETEDSATIARSATISAGPKLISLEEARQRIFPHRKISESLSLEGSSSNSPRHKLRSSSIPPKVAASPISPLPTLLSIEEAQARTKLKFNPTRRGSADLMQIRNNMNSPKRSKKWFGLFSKMKSDGVSEDDSILKSNVTSAYRKKTSMKNIHHIGTPTRSQSEYRLQDLPKQQTDSGHIPRVSSFDVQPTEKHCSAISVESLNYNFKDSDDDNTSLMSAVVSVTAKYINAKDVRKNSTSNPPEVLRKTSTTKPIDEIRKKGSRKSFTIGEPTDFRRLEDTEIHVVPSKNGIVKSDFTCDVIEQGLNSDLKLPISESRTPSQLPFKGKHAPSDSHDSGYLSQTNTTVNSEVLSKQIEASSTQITSPERKHQRSGSNVLRDIDENVPQKKIRSLSPENYHIESKITTHIYTEPRPSSQSSHSNDIQNRFLTRSMTDLSRDVQPQINKTESNVKSSNSNIHVKHKSFSHIELDTPTKSSHNYVNTNSDSIVSQTLSKTPTINNGTPLNKAHIEAKFTSDSNERADTKENRVVDMSPVSNPKHVYVSIEDALDPKSRAPKDNDEQLLDLLVKRTEHHIKYGGIPRKDYNDGQNSFESAKAGALVKSTQERFSPTFNGNESPKTKSFILKKQQAVSLSTEELQKENGSQRVQSRDRSHDRKHVDSNKSHEIVLSRYINMDEIDTPKTVDEIRPRSRSVKERVSLFGSVNKDLNVTSKDSQFSQPDLSRTTPCQHERTKSHPNLYMRTEQQPKIHNVVTRNSKTSNKNTTQNYINTTNRHSSYIARRFDSDELLSSSREDSKYINSRLHAVSVPRLNVSSASVPRLNVSSVPKLNSHMESSLDHPANDRLVMSTKTRSNDPKLPHRDYNKEPLKDFTDNVDGSHGNIRIDRRRNTHSPNRSSRTEVPRPISMDFSAITSTDYRSHHASDDFHPHFRSGDYRDAASNDHRTHQFMSRNPRPHHVSATSLASARSHPHLLNSVHKSSSDHYLGENKQIGSFPLTLKSGSERNSRVNVKQTARPSSLYDNDRKSYYDNVNSIHYEML
ncbi:rho GTPase-activating protein 32-like isoform X1 [Hydractinia symbiolongicarpus]|uniref:rho GTPase-activating protein 32-like isoform X1 n=1 Tax=Hydractinia symbiolongicarpus TaxID=13093 RepID=UPI00255038C7|nr:rho GTPase-activating protein 32-like isoform X1 [Hydractinia symbiolongicarpus]